MSVAATILIADDYNTMIGLVRKLLRRLGFRAIGGAAAVKPQAKHYALVIADPGR